MYMSGVSSKLEEISGEAPRLWFQKGAKLVVIHSLEDMRLTEDIVIDTTKDAVVIDGVSKIFKKSRPLLRLPWREHKEEKPKVRPLHVALIQCNTTTQFAILA